MKVLSLAIQNKLLLAILTGVASIGSFQVWQYNQAQYEKRMRNAKNDCGVYIELGEDAVRFSPSLKAVKYQNKILPGLEQPGINSESADPGDYVMILRSQSSTLPPNAKPFDDPFFTSLLNKETLPKTLMVSVVSFDKSKKQATVESYCTKKPFVVDMDNLYERSQTIDRNLKHSGFDILF
ncbi:hypothetical protein IQ274_36145 [Nostoc sp. LEGE 12447]|uniref:hypothetical protein n=1 Tax=unclassified Nostoc TaxID=2593658 RepID=UPI000CF35596|nr:MULTISPECIES: hypothetical protein [unclassified Nostoc]AVH68267.1 hypothetical protein NPM_10193 [Nostoc sp. 'Peltigera membranacea cyanobiont' N6]MBD2513215.1 hypothetical protein [Desmonostoc muscorum FACHB-395]MBE9003440.1 hypothetical protein [Nostoc sp. LEGE 12447]MEA5604501.1 hypothetical protein [Nostoc sp. UHCC 0252]